MAEDLIYENIPVKIPENVRKKLPKLIFLILGAIIVIEAFFVVKALRQTVPPVQRLSPRPVGDAQLVLVSDKKVYKIGDTILVQVRIDSGGHPTQGSDVILKYDPAVLEASISGVSAGKVFNEYPLADVDNKSGTIRISGIAGVQSKGFNGVGILANLSLRAKRAGNANILFEFKEGATTESNVIDLKTAQDILGKVTNLNIKIQ